MIPDNSPVGFTCSKIEKVIDLVKRYYVENSVMKSCDFEEFEEEMEKIRHDNAALRDWDNECFATSGDFKRELEKAEYTVRDLEAKITELEGKPF